MRWGRKGTAVISEGNCSEKKKMLLIEHGGVNLKCDEHLLKEVEWEK